MNEIERLLAEYEYIRDDKKVERDVAEFMSTLQAVCSLFATKESIDKMQPKDLLSFLVSMKNFNDEIKPIAIKYAILPNIIGGE